MLLIKSQKGIKKANKNNQSSVVVTFYFNDPASDQFFSKIDWSKKLHKQITFTCEQYGQSYIQTIKRCFR